MQGMQVLVSALGLLEAERFPGGAGSGIARGITEKSKYRQLQLMGVHAFNAQVEPSPRRPQTSPPRPVP